MFGDRETKGENKLFLPDADVSPIRPRQRGVADANNLKQSGASTRTLVAQAAVEAGSIEPPPTVSVVIGSYNRASLLRLAVQSVRENFSGLEGEIIVVDGGSTDGSIEYLSAQQDVISIIQHNRYSQDGRERRRKSWGGFMNMGFRAAAGRYVVMISDDCLLYSDAISNSIKHVESAEATGLKVGACAYFYRNWPDERDYYVQRTLGGNLMVNHGLYLKSALEDVGYADEDNYAFYKADTDLSLRIWRAGYSITASEKAICDHYIGRAEKARASNMKLIEQDRAAMRKLWPKLVTREAVEKMGKITLKAPPPSMAETLWREIYDSEARRLDTAS